MEIAQLHYFRTAARCENFTQAAEKLGITQSALSRSIANMEKELGFRLFERIGNRLSLNQHGKAFLFRAINILNTLDSAIEETKAMAGLEYGTVRIAVSETIFLKNVIFNFIKKHPRVHISCMLRSDEDIRVALEEGDVDFSVTRNPIIGASFSGELIFRDHMMAILPPGHPLCGRAGLHLDELSHEHFIISNVNYSATSEIEIMCSEAGFDPDIIYKGIGEDLAGNMVQSGYGVMLAPYSASRGLIDLNMQHSNEREKGIPILDPFCGMNVIITSRLRQFHSEAALELYDDIIRYFKELK